LTLGGEGIPFNTCLTTLPFHHLRQPLWQYINIVILTYFDWFVTIKFQWKSWNFAGLAQRYQNFYMEE